MKKLILIAMLLIPTFLSAEIAYGESALLDMGESSAIVKSAAVVVKVDAQLSTSPNPFNPSTVISFNLVKPSLTSLEVYNVNGKLVASLVQEKLNTGKHSINWNAAGKSSGVYYFKLSVGNKVYTSRALLLK